jgi:hypothetical protein
MSAMRNRDGAGGKLAPTLGEPGLIAYECPNCVYVKSELLQPGTKR